MEAQQLMTFPATTVRPDLHNDEALVFAKSHGIHHLPLEENGDIIGLVCTCDLQDLDLKAPISQAMKGNPVVVSPRDSSRHIAELMRHHCISSVLVRASEGWGIVTKDDLLKVNSLDEKTLELIEACRCMYCRTYKHLRRHGNSFACVGCLDRAQHPERFEEGEVD